MRLWRKIRERWGEDGLAEEMRAHREMIEDRLRAEGLLGGRGADAGGARVRSAGDGDRGSPGGVDLGVGGGAVERRQVRVPGAGAGQDVRGDRGADARGGVGAGVGGVHALQRVRAASVRGDGPGQPVRGAVDGEGYNSSASTRGAISSNCEPRRRSSRTPTRRGEYSSAESTGTGPGLW